MPKVFVNLDAMIPRADFAAVEEGQKGPQTIDLSDRISLRDLSADNFFSRLLRKPDFQRETNQWSPQQVQVLLQSFLDGELIPAVILWRSQTNVFVIDGGHRLSALLGWMQDDYGDGPLSATFFRGEIPAYQRQIADRTRREIARTVGTSQHFTSRSMEDVENDPVLRQRQMSFATRGIQVQWITGDADKAESSFFKINTQGAILDPTEALILKNRRKAAAIAARSVVRASTGHKYWSKFPMEAQEKIQDISRSVHKLLFAPELNSSVRTLDLPMGGTASTTDALALLMALSSLVDGTVESIDKTEDDLDGLKTVLLLKKIEKVLERMVGSGPGSLGLHPLVWFYTAQGRHYEPLFLAMFGLISEKIRDNHASWFKDITEVRREVEEFLVDNKTVVTLLISAIGSRQRIENARKAVETIIYAARSGVDPTMDEMARALGLETRLYSINHKVGEDFSEITKSAAFVREALKSALRCPICGGYLDPAKSMTYDHDVRRQDGGDGSLSNCRLAHPFCNSGVKN